MRRLLDRVVGRLSPAGREPESVALPTPGVREDSASSASVGGSGRAESLAGVIEALRRHVAAGSGGRLRVDDVDADASIFDRGYLDMEMPPSRFACLVLALGPRPRPRTLLRHARLGRGLEGFGRPRYRRQEADEGRDDHHGQPAVAQDAGHQQRRARLRRREGNEEALQERERALEIGGSEEDPSDVEECEVDGDGDEPGQAPRDTAPEQPVQAQEEALVGPPHHERPRRAVPEPGEQKHDPQVGIAPDRPSAVAAQGKKEVVAHEAREGDVPALPELREGAREIRAVEVLEELDPDHAAEADRHVRVPGEVEVDLEAVGQDAHPHGGRVEVGGRSVEHGVGRLRQHVGDEDLLAEARAEPADPREESLGGVRAGDELTVHVAVPDDGSGDQVGKETDVEEAKAKGSRGSRNPAIDVDDVADLVEGEEGDPDGQRDRDPWSRLEAQRRRQTSELGRGEGRIFEPAQQPQVQGQGGQEPSPTSERAEGRRRDRLADHPIDPRGRDEHEDEPRRAPRVEEEAGGQQHAVSSARRRKVVGRQRDRQEREQEDEGAEDHERTGGDYVRVLRARANEGPDLRTGALLYGDAPPPHPAPRRRRGPDGGPRPDSVASQRRPLRGGDPGVAAGS